ncbi:MAG: molecular chaperone [bacterium]
MTETTNLHTIDLALCRSGFYEALALGFRPPTAETFERLLSEVQNRALAEMVGMLENMTSDSRPIGWSKAVLRLRSCTDAQNLDSLECSYRFYFGHTARPKVPPYETEYGTETLFQQPQQLSDISGFFAAFGLTLNGQEKERVDHISCECEFLAFVTRKEAYAIEVHDEDMLQQTRQAQKLFLQDHLGRFVPAFTHLLMKENPGSFYALLAELARKFIFQECAQFGVPAGPENLRLRPETMENACFTCGSGEEVIQDLCHVDEDAD